MANHVTYGALLAPAHKAPRPMTEWEAREADRKAETRRVLQRASDQGLLKLRFPEGELVGKLIRFCDKGCFYGGVVRFPNNYHGFFWNSSDFHFHDGEAPPPPPRVEKVVVQTTRVVAAPQIVQRQVQVTREVSVLQRIFRR